MGGARPNRSSWGTWVTIMDRVLDDYAPVVAGVENDIDEIEDEVFNGTAGAPRRVYELSREVNRIPARHQAAAADDRTPHR